MVFVHLYITRALLSLCGALWFEQAESQLRVRLTSVATGGDASSDDTNGEAEPARVVVELLGTIVARIARVLNCATALQKSPVH
jgi:hypothetical protein